MTRNLTYPQALPIDRKPQAPGAPPPDWEYLTNVAARVQGEAWIHILVLWRTATH